MIDELALISILLTVVALISCLSAEEKRRIRRLPRWAWVVVIMLVPVAGSIGWFVLGRPLRSLAAQRRSGTATRPQGPDDDPDFLRSLDG